MLQYSLPGSSRPLDLDYARSSVDRSGRDNWKREQGYQVQHQGRNRKQERDRRQEGGRGSLNNIDSVGEVPIGLTTARSGELVEGGTTRRRGDTLDRLDKSRDRNATSSEHSRSSTLESRSDYRPTWQDLDRKDRRGLSGRPRYSESSTDMDGDSAVWSNWQESFNKLNLDLNKELYKNTKGPLLENGRWRDGSKEPPEFRRDGRQPPVFRSFREQGSSRSHGREFEQSPKYNKDSRRYISKQQSSYETYKGNDIRGTLDTKGKQPLRGHEPNHRSLAPQTKSQRGYSSDSEDPESWLERQRKKLHASRTLNSQRGRLDQQLMTESQFNLATSPGGTWVRIDENNNPAYSSREAKGSGTTGWDKSSTLDSRGRSNMRGTSAHRSFSFTTGGEGGRYQSLPRNTRMDTSLRSEPSREKIHQYVYEDEHLRRTGRSNGYDGIFGGGSGQNRITEQNDQQQMARQDRTAAHLSRKAQSTAALNENSPERGFYKDYTLRSSSKGRRDKPRIHDDTQISLQPIGIQYLENYEPNSRNGTMERKHATLERSATLGSYPTSSSSAFQRGDPRYASNGSRESRYASNGLRDSRRDEGYNNSRQRSQSRDRSFAAKPQSFTIRPGFYTAQPDPVVDTTSSRMHSLTIDSQNSYSGQNGAQHGWQAHRDKSRERVISSKQPGEVKHIGDTLERSSHYQTSDSLSAQKNAPLKFGSDLQIRGAEPSVLNKSDSEIRRPIPISPNLSGYRYQNGMSSRFMNSGSQSQRNDIQVEQARPSGRHGDPETPEGAIRNYLEAQESVMTRELAASGRQYGNQTSTTPHTNSRTQPQQQWHQSALNQGSSALDRSQPHSQQQNMLQQQSTQQVRSQVQHQQQHQQPGYNTAQHSGQNIPQHLGHISAQHPRNADTHHTGQINSNQPGHGTNQHSGHASAQQAGYVPSQQPGYVQAQQPGHITAQQPSYISIQQEPQYSSVNKDGKIPRNDHQQTIVRSASHFTSNNQTNVPPSNGTNQSSNNTVQTSSGAPPGYRLGPQRDAIMADLEPFLKEFGDSSSTEIIRPEIIQQRQTTTVQQRFPTSQVRFSEDGPSTTVRPQAVTIHQSSISRPQHARVIDPPQPLRVQVSSDTKDTRIDHPQSLGRSNEFDYQEPAAYKRPMNETSVTTRINGNSDFASQGWQSQGINHHTNGPFKERNSQSLSNRGDFNQSSFGANSSYQQDSYEGNTRREPKNNYLQVNQQQDSYSGDNQTQNGYKIGTVTQPQHGYTFGTVTQPQEAMFVGSQGFAEGQQQPQEIQPRNESTLRLVQPCGDPGAQRHYPGTQRYDPDGGIPQQSTFHGGIQSLSRDSRGNAPEAYYSQPQTNANPHMPGDIHRLGAMNGDRFNQNDQSFKTFELTPKKPASNSSLDSPHSLDLDARVRPAGIYRSSSPNTHSSPSVSVDRSSGGSLISDGAEIGGGAYSIKFIRDISSQWYRPQMAREQIVATLKSLAPGSFIVRDSSSYPGSFALAVKVAELPANIQAKGDSSDDLVRHFLIEPTPKGVRLKGYKSEPVFGSLAALVYQHTLTPIALPCRLILPAIGSVNHNEVHMPSSSKQMPIEGTTSTVLYLLTQDTETLTGPEAVERIASRALSPGSAPAQTTVVQLSVSADGVTVTDNKRKLFFRRHYPLRSITYCGTDRTQRRWTEMDQNTGRNSDGRIFGFVSRKLNNPSSNECHLFAEIDMTSSSKSTEVSICDVMARFVQRHVTAVK